ncbi:MAG TPA: HDOD domain-containing protein [Spirochaetota bacterium]|nr:HDOD domain-containing protein [Spirochaetota bacterium]
MIIEQRKQIYDKIFKGEPVKLSFKYVTDDLLMFINSILTRELAKHDLQYLIYSVVTILRELIVNSLKANAKRIFFNINSLDINNPAQYKEGIEKFKDEVVGDFESIKNDILNNEHSINFNITEESDSFIFTVKNSVPIIPEELSRINSRIALAAQKSSFNDIYDQIKDETEGAGLGIALIVMFLKSMGINPSYFIIKSDGKVTVASVQIPFVLKPVEVLTIVKKQILEEITGLPTFPENIITLLDMCSSPDADIEKITQTIKLDVSVTSDVIKLANSAGFISGQRVEDINRAVMKIGLKNLKFILLASNARKIMESRYNKFEEIWEHCNRVAFYSRQIALKFKLPGAGADNAYIAGLLHDLGQIILLTVDMDSVRKIAEIVQDRNIITTTVMEELSIGISHAEIGLLLSEKWNFPEFLSQIIRFHHSPISIPEEFRDVGFSVYLANMIVGIEKRRYYYYYIEEMVLERFNIKSESELRKLNEFLKQEYDNSQKRS